MWLRAKKHQRAGVKQKEQEMAEIPPTQVDQDDPSCSAAGEGSGGGDTPSAAAAGDPQPPEKQPPRSSSLPKWSPIAPAAATAAAAAAAAVAAAGDNGKTAQLPLAWSELPEWSREKDCCLNLCFADAEEDTTAMLELNNDYPIDRFPFGVKVLMGLGAWFVYPAYIASLADRESKHGIDKAIATVGCAAKRGDTPVLSGRGGDDASC